MNKLPILLVAAFATLALTSGSAFALDFNVNYSTPILNSSTQNQLFNVSIGNNASFNLAITSLQLRFFTSDGVAVINGTNFTSNASAVANNIMGFTDVLQFPQTILTWSTNASGLVVPTNSVANFSVNISTPLSSNPSPVIVNATFANGTVESSTIFFSLNTPPVTGVVTLKGPGNTTVWPSNNVNVQFNVSGTANQYACLAFVNQTTPFGTQFVPAASPPNFTVPNNTNTNMTLFLPNGVWQWNVKCTPKNSYNATRTSSGYNVTLNGQPASLNSFKVGDIVTFTNNLSQTIRITLSPPFSPNYTIDLSPGASNSTDTSPDFSNPLSQKPPLLGPFSDNASDQFTQNFLGGFGQSGDPRFAPGVFAVSNFTLNVSGGSMGAGFDPGNFFNPSIGFSFSGGPCTLPTKPAFCNQTASGGVPFNPNDAGFFDNHPDFQLSGFTDCTNPANAAKTDCQIIFNPNARITGDTTPPNTLFTKINAFSDKAFIDLGTDKMSNATIDYYGVDKYCGNKLVTITDQGVTNPLTGALMQNSMFKPFHHFEISSVMFSNITLSSNSSYYYKTNICDPAGNCVSSSSCKNFNSSTSSFASTPVPINFTIPSGFNFKFRFPNGTEAAVGSTTNFANMTNVTMRFQPTNANWGIDLPASAITTASSFDFSNGFKTVSSGGRTFVGMNKTVWDALAQRLGITAINVTIIGTANTLNKCDENGANCNDVTSMAVQVATNATAGTATWTIPVTLGFSTYVDNPTAISASSSSSSSGGYGGGGQGASAVTKEVRNIIVGTAPTMLVMNNPGAHGVVEIDIAANSPTGVLQVSVDTLGTSRPANVAQDVAGIVYRYLGINVSIDDSNVASANVTFNVNSSWLSQNNIDPSTVALERYHNATWQRLATSLASSNSTTRTYVSQTPGFSTFAIVGQVLAAPSQAPVQTPATPQQPQAPAAKAPDATTVAIVGAVAAAAVLAAVLFVKRRRR